MSDNLDIDELCRNLRQKRDELQLKMHLASMDITEEWDKAKKQLDALEDNINSLSGEARETSHEVLSGLEIIGKEVGDAFDRIKHRLG